MLEKFKILRKTIHWFLDINKTLIETALPMRLFSVPDFEELWPEPQFYE